MRYLVIIEKAEANYGAYIPDLPGCVAIGDTVDEVTQQIHEAARFHIEGMLKDGEPIPTPSSVAAHVDLDVSQPV